jgi:hypothetical protein
VKCTWHREAAQTLLLQLQLLLLLLVVVQQLVEQLLLMQQRVLLVQQQQQRRLLLVVQQQQQQVQSSGPAEVTILEDVLLEAGVPETVRVEGHGRVQAGLGRCHTSGLGCVLNLHW